MGLLDDAIREHLELKRRRGADPGEVAREQREALDPLTGPGDDTAPSELAELGSTPEEHLGAKLSEAPSDDVQETEELDMDSVFQQDIHEETGARLAEEESLEWEMPGDADARTAPDAPQARMAGAGEDPPVADEVREETADVLRETPEQDRLWFEQKPPRDFDFDK